MFGNQLQIRLYRGKKDPTVTFHAFPLQNKQLLQNWLNRLARKDFTPTKFSRLCSLHFKPEDFVENSTDQKSSRLNKKENLKLVKRRLQKHACPSIFKDMPAYFQSNDAPARSGLSDSKSRHENEAARLEKRCESFLKTDVVENFDDLITKIDEDMNRQEYKMYQTQLGVNFVHLTKECPPSILATVVVKKNFEVTVFRGQQIVPASSYTHILSSNKISLLSQISNIVAFAKSFQCTKSMLHESLKSKLVALVDDLLKKSENDREIRFLKFLSEQLKLMLQNKHCRRYSTDLLMLSYIIYSTSSRAYERLLDEKVLVLPSIKTLKKITMNLNQRTGINDFKYLSLRYSQLNAFDRNVILMIDEIYLSKRVEASGGQIFGLTENCEVAATALCFMIKSFSSGYKDMVGIYPVKNLEAETEKNCFDKVMLLLYEVGFNVVGLSVDNAAGKQEIFQRLPLRWSVERIHPQSVYWWKNIFNI